MIAAQQKHVRNWINMDGGTGMYSDDRMNGHFEEPDPDRHEQERALFS